MPVFYDFWYTTLQMNTNDTGKFYYVACYVHPLPGDIMLTSLKSCHSLCTWHCHRAAERDAKSLSHQRCDHTIRQMWIRWTMTTASGVSFKRGFADPWCEGVHLLSGWRLLDHAIIVAVIAQWCSSLHACVRMNGGHFEHEFWASDFLLCFVSSILVPLNVIDINMCKVLILCEMCYFCVWDFHALWKQQNEFVTGNSYASDFGILLWSSAWKSVNICKSYGKIISDTFFMWTWCRCR